VGLCCKLTSRFEEQPNGLRGLHEAQKKKETAANRPLKWSNRANAFASARCRASKISVVSMELEALEAWYSFDFKTFGCY
jgi:hypothetical protein